jgi:uncharacterized protein (DUF2141 family)
MRGHPGYALLPLERWRGIIPTERCRREGSVRKKQWRLAIRDFSSPLILLFLSTVPALSAELRLTIDGVRSESGEILIGLYDDADGFKNAIANAGKRGLVPDSERLVGTAIRAQRGTQSTVFTQLAPGRYAMIVIHDENDNGRLDENFLGAPTEGYGFSNDARSLFSAPSFDAAAVAVGDADVSALITLTYPRAPWAKDDRE